MVTYEQWNKAIISYFFEDCEPGQIVFLQTTAEMLSEVADVELSDFNVVDAAESLTEVVREKVVLHDSVDLWTVNPPISGDLWAEFSEREPPQIAFLALMVLAASMMETSDDVLHTNYYVPLNQLLFGEQRKGCPNGIHLWQIEKFWKHLQLWAEDQHHVQFYLTEGPQKQKYVWYPKSQCMISKHDRRSIYCFFRDHKLTPFSDISDNQLEEIFGAWLQSSTVAKIKRHFSNNSYKQSILSQVKSLLEHWDGEIPPEPLHSERQTTASVNVELRRDPFDNNAEIRYWLPTRGRDKIKCKTNSLGIQCLQPSHLKKWFQPIIDNRGAFWNWNLLNYLQLQTDEMNPIIYTLGPSDIWIFQKDSERDGWFSQQYMQLYKDHLIMFQKRLAGRVIGCLRQTCEQEIEKPNPIYVDGKEVDWLSLRVEPTKFVSFSDQKLWRLSVRAAKRLSLVGGLSVTDENGRKAYLDICLPNVFIPDLGLPDQEPLLVDGKVFSVGENSVVTLDNALKPGFHLLTYGRQTRELRVISLERSLEHRDQTLIAFMSEDQTTMPTYAVKEVSEISEGTGIWLAGAKIFGDIPPPPPLANDKFSRIPAHIISSVVKVAIDFKQGKTSVPEWFDEAIEYIDHNVALRAFVEKKLNLYHETALSYMELRKQIGE